MAQSGKPDFSQMRPGPGGPGGRFGGPGRGMPVQKPKNFKATMGRLWGWFGTERKRLTLVMVLVLTDAGLMLLAPWLIGRGIDALDRAAGVDFSRLLKVVFALGAAYLIDASVNLMQGFAMAGVSQRIVRNLRTGIHHKLRSLPMQYFDTHTHGELMSRLTNDVDNISNTISQATAQLMQLAVTVTGSLIMMLVLSPLLTLAALVTLPLVFLLTKMVTSHTQSLFKAQQAALGTLNGQIEETMSGLEVVKAFNCEGKVEREFSVTNDRLCRVGMKAQIWSGYLMPLMNVINNLGFAAVACFGGVLAVRDLISVGVIASFLSYTRQFVRPLNEIANIYNVLQTAVAGAERVFEVMDEAEEPKDRNGAVPLENIRGEVTFRDVSFGYRPDVPVMDHVSFHVPAGSTVALVGPTGAGKTTVVNLLTRFYDVTSGSIVIDGRDIRDYTRDSLQQGFGIVLQDTYLFASTIAENIRYGRPDASDGEVEQAAKMADAHGFISRLREGYNTMLTESGSNLSQGQRQLLAIARAVLANSPILILDEATSSVDTRTELRIQQAMLTLTKGRTSFIIAHRLSTIRSADNIMVIDRGQLIEQGTHAQLLEQGGFYANMYLSQLKKTDPELA